jgi:hypothetical protein
VRIFDEYDKLKGSETLMCFIVANVSRCGWQDDASFIAGA